MTAGLPPGMECGAIAPATTLGAHPYTFHQLRCARPLHPRTESHLTDWVYPVTGPAPDTGSAEANAEPWRPLPGGIHPPRALRVEWWD